MDWNRIQANWKEFAGSVRQEWSKLSEEQISLLKGERDKLADLLHEVYGTARAEADKQISAWQSAQASALDRAELKWKHFAVDVKHHWNKLTQDQIEAVAGNRDRLIDLIQQTYGKAREEVEQQFSAWEKQQKEGWSKVEEDWQQLLGSVQQHWSKLSQEQIKAIAGQRDRLVHTLQDVYGATLDAVEKQVSAWQAGLKKDTNPTREKKKH
jgi:uncharacterized protein YjbJ (UPF0337 family)